MPEQRFYRIVKTDPPVRRDFLSNQARRGEPKPDLPPPLRRLWDGLSVHDTLTESLRQAREIPWLGGYVAELLVSREGECACRWERTVTHNQGHFTLWGDPDDLLGCVVRVVRTGGDAG